MISSTNSISGFWSSLERPDSPSMSTSSMSSSRFFQGPKNRVKGRVPVLNNVCISQYVFHSFFIYHYLLHWRVNLQWINIHFYAIATASKPKNGHSFFSSCVSSSCLFLAFSGSPRLVWFHLVQSQKLPILSFEAPFLSLRHCPVRCIMQVGRDPKCCNN